MKSFSWLLPKNLLSESISVMAPQGRVGSEGLALWMGYKKEGNVYISHVIELFGPGFVTSPLHMSLSLSAMASLTQFAEQHNIFLVGQIHSHPGTLINLSDIDKRMGIRVPNYLSVVCPHYAQIPETSMNECGVHIFDIGAYRQLSSKEIKNRIIQIDHSLTKIRMKVSA